MQYFGGKARISPVIAGHIQPYVEERTYWEPFCGVAWVMHRIRSPLRLGSDKNQSLIMLWQELLAGWSPPTEVSEEEYEKLRSCPAPSAMRAFVGFGCSFAGKWFGGYARSNVKRNYAENAQRSLGRKVASLENSAFFCADYKDVLPHNFCIYCDPPYAGTTEYGAIGEFDSDQFWEVMRKWRRHNIVFVSEYSAPPDFTCVLEIETKTDIRNSTGMQDYRKERLFR